MNKIFILVALIAATSVVSAKFIHRRHFDENESDCGSISHHDGGSDYDDHHGHSYNKHPTHGHHGHHGHQGHHGHNGHYNHNDLNDHHDHHDYHDHHDHNDHHGVHHLKPKHPKRQIKHGHSHGHDLGGDSHESGSGSTQIFNPDSGPVFIPSGGTGLSTGHHSGPKKGSSHGSSSGSGHGSGSSHTTGHHRKPVTHSTSGTHPTSAKGHVRNHEAQLNQLHASKSGHVATQSEAHKNDLHSVQDKLDAGAVHANHNENSGIHKHQVISKDKTREKTVGVNDVDGFHHSNSNFDGAHISKEHNDIDAHNIGASTGTNAGFEKELDLINASESSKDIGGAVNF